MTKTAKSYIAAVILAGVALTALALVHWRSDDPTRLAVFLFLFAGAATLKCRVPGVTGTYSPLFFFVLLGSTTLSFSELAAASALGGIVQCTFHQQRRPSLLQVCFNGANVAISAASAFVLVQRQVPGLTEQPLLLSLILGASAFYFVNTALVSVVLTLVERGSILEIWRHWCLGSLPYYFVGALIVGATTSAQYPGTPVVVILVTPAIVLATMYFHLRLRSSSGRSLQ